MHFALVRRARLKPGDTVLVQVASDGIGTAAMQLAVALEIRVTAVVPSEDKIGTAKPAGADEVVLVKGFEKAVRGRGPRRRHRGLLEIDQRRARGMVLLDIR